MNKRRQLMREVGLVGILVSGALAANSGTAWIHDHHIIAIILVTAAIILFVASTSLRGD